MLKERNYSVDTLKFICAVLVIFIHIGTPYYNYPLPLTRIAVPCFFMISGYFIFTEPDNMQRRLLKSTRRMLWIFLWSTALYFAYYAVTNGDWSIFTWKNTFYFLFLNQPPFGGHLWYLSAYLYVLIIMLFVNRFRLWKPCFFLVPILLLCNLIFGKYDVLIFNHNFNLILSRNFLFMGIPYFALGCLVKKHWNALCVIKPKLIIRGGI